jgi:hypothetical protein
VAGCGRTGPTIRRISRRAPTAARLYGFEKTTGWSSHHGRKATKPAFVELIAPQEECVIEFESPRGTKMRIQWKASTPHDWVSLLRAWREAEG